MIPFAELSGLVAPMDRANVDTDVIIPKQFLKSIRRSGFGPNLFDELRYLDEGQPDSDNSRRPLNPDFPLNQARYVGAEILLTRANFGCGSSREHAPWALADYGFRAIIAPSFADIFHSNCFKNGILPIVLEEKIVSILFGERMRAMVILLPSNWRSSELLHPVARLSRSKWIHFVSAVYSKVSTILA